MKNDRDLFEFWKKTLGSKVESKEDHLTNLINKNLLQVLYYPVTEPTKTKVDHSRLEYFEIDPDEPINWGDLSVSWVDVEGNTICIEEAAPDQCPSLCEYIAKYLDAWGWGEFEIITEW